MSTTPTPVTAAPTLESVEWQPDGSARVVWTNNVASSAVRYTAVYIDARRAGSGTYAQVNAATTVTAVNAQAITVSGLDLAAGWDITLRAHGPAGTSERSSAKSLAALATPAPTITEAARLSGSQLRVRYTENATAPATVTRTYLELREAGQDASAWRQVNAGVGGELHVYGLDGAKAYELRAWQAGPAGASPRTALREIPVFWREPNATVDLSGSRVSATSASLTWSATITPDRPVTGWRVLRADGDLGQLRAIATLPATARAYTDSTIVGTRAYTFSVVPYNAVGEASSRPTVTVPAATVRPQPPSAAPTVAEWTGVEGPGGSRVRITWARNIATDRPYGLQHVMGRSPIGGTMTLATVSGTATEAQVVIPDGWTVEFAILPENTAGRAATTSPWSAPVAARPTQMPPISVAWAGLDARVTWPAFVTSGDTVEIQHSTNQTDWFPGGTVPTTGHSWTHPAPGTTTDRWYRARAVATGSAITPPGPWTAPVKLGAHTAPLAPTVILPGPVDATGPIPVTWTHNPVDGSAQTSAQVRHQVNFGTPSAWTTITGPTATWSLPANAATQGQFVSVEVRTAGASGVYGPSTIVSTSTAARPQVTLTAPTGSTWGGQDLPVTWEAVVQTAARVELLDESGRVIDSQTVGATERAVTFAGVPDGATLTVRVAVRDSRQWSLPVTRTLTVTVDRPIPPLVTAAWRDADQSVMLTARPYAGWLRVRANGVAWEWAERTSPQVSLPGTTLVRPDGTTLTGTQIRNLGTIPGGAQTLAISGGPRTKLTMLVTSIEDGSTTATIEIRNNDDAVIEAHQITDVPRWPAHREVAIDWPSDTLPGQGRLAILVPGPSGGIVVAQVALISQLNDGDDWSWFDLTSTTAWRRYDADAGGVPINEYAPSDETTGLSYVPSPPLVRVEYHTSIDGGATWQPVDGQPGLDWSLHDRYAPLGRERLLYRARGWAANGAYTDSEPVAVSTKNGQDVWLHLADGTAVHGGWNPAMSGTAGRRSVLRSYVGDDGLPSVVFGAKLPRMLRVGVTLDTDTSPLSAWIDASEHDGPVIYRDPAGRVWKAAVTGFGWDDGDALDQSVAFEVTRVR